VIFAEVNTSIAKSWVKLASNAQHFVAWDSRNEDEIEKTKNIILARSCQGDYYINIIIKVKIINLNDSLC
jgi:hypothetical protein